MSFYVTTPIYYVNSNPHLGHAYTTILADVAGRYYRLTGVDTFFLTGTDEHGDKIEKAAKNQNMATQEMVDRNAQNFKDLLGPINCRPEDFIRTTEQRHKKVVQDILQKVFDKEDIYKADYSGKYCYGCERYLGDDELVEGKCSDHKVEPELISESNYFFKMSKYWEQLKNHIEENPEYIVPQNFKNEVLGLLKQEPQDLCISRPKSRLTWGIELPFDKDYVTYVWFDALINYLSALDFPEGERYKKYWSSAHHVLAKDILKPHCIYWQTMLLSLGIDLSKQLAIHGYWLIDDGKMSKSQGRTVDPAQYCADYTSDIFRYFLMRGMRFGKDASFSHDEFVNLVNAECSNNFGNLISRVAGMCKKNFDNKVPAAPKIGAAEKELEAKAISLESKLSALIKDWKTAEYLEEIVNFANDLNKYLDETKPWSLAKDETKKDELATILRVALEGIRVCFVWLYPVVPEKSIEIAESLGVAESDLYASAKSFYFLKDNQDLPAKVSGFPRIEDKAK
jgi:methionyl-tRNA synthetase